MTVQTTIYHKLAAITTAYPDSLTANPTLPSVTYKFISESPEPHHGGKVLSKYRLQVDCWAMTRSAANTLAYSVKSALDYNKTGIELITPENAIDFNDPETGIERRILEFFVWDV